MCQKAKNSVISFFSKGGRLISRYKRQSLKNKLIFVFLFVTILPILSLQSISYFYSTKSIQKKISELSQENLIQVEKNLDTTIISYKDMISQIITNDKIIEMTKKLNSDVLMERVDASSVLSLELTRLITSMRGIRTIAIFTEKGYSKICGQYTAKPEENIWNKNKEPLKTKIYTKAMKQGTIVFESMNYEKFSNNENFINIAIRIVDPISFKSKLGVVVMSLDETVISNASSYTISDSPVKEARNITFIVDSEGMIISYPDKKYLGERVAANKSNLNADSFGEFLKKTTMIPSDNFLISTLYQEQTGWTIVNAIDKGFLFDEVYTFQRVSVIWQLSLLSWPLFRFYILSMDFPDQLIKWSVK